MSVRVRMAPSPTGFLHIGGVRTFLFNWLFARSYSGECLLRIENTDTGREVAESVEQIERSLRWLGIEWDGETRFQLDGAERCRTEAARLVAEGRAYEDDGAIRIRMPEEGVVGWDDAVKGRIEFPADQLEDMVILRSDGRPVYNFASPVDDWVDGITHVIRGDDHVSNTPKQIVVLRALGADLPVYAHAPNVFGEDGKKLSKRHGAVSVGEFREAGYIAPALMNFLALLGWAPDGETTIMSRDELAERFTLEKVGSSPATFDYAKLDWMNGLYLRALDAGAYADTLVTFLREQGSTWNEARVREAAPAVQEKIGRLGEFAGFAGFLFEDVDPDLTLLDGGVLTEAASQLATVEPWDAATIERALKALCERLEAKPKTVYLPIRVAVTGVAYLARPVREPRAARARRHARAAASGRRRGRVSSFRDLIGVELGPTGWLEVSQARIDAFAQATDDEQWIHVDPVRAAEGPFGTTIAHGYLTLALCAPLLSEAVAGLVDSSMSINYGTNRVRFPAPVPAGSRLRARVTVASVDDIPGGEQVVLVITVEREGEEKPVCVAETVQRRLR